MSLNPANLKEVAEFGVNLQINNTYSPAVLKEIVAIAMRKGSTIVINADYPPKLLKELAEQYGNKITFIV